MMSQQQAFMREAILSNTKATATEKSGYYALVFTRLPDSKKTPKFAMQKGREVDQFEMPVSRQILMICQIASLNRVQFVAAKSVYATRVKDETGQIKTVQKEDVVQGTVVCREPDYKFRVVPAPDDGPVMLASRILRTELGELYGDLERIKRAPEKRVANPANVKEKMLDENKGKPLTKRQLHTLKRAEQKWKKLAYLPDFKEMCAANDIDPRDIDEIMDMIAEAIRTGWSIEIVTP